MRNVLAKFTFRAYIRPMKFGSHIRSLAIAISSMGIFLPVSAYAQSASPVSAKVHISGSCVKCDLSNRNLPGLSFQGSNFSGSNFTNANLSGAQFDGANLSNTQFNKAYLMRIQGSHVVLSDSTLYSATLTEAVIISSDFSGSNFKRADLTRGDFSGTNFTKSTFKGTDAIDCRFTGSNFTNAKLDHGNFTGSDFTNANMSNVKFGDANVTNSRFEGAIFNGANLSKASGLTQNQLLGACGNDQTRLPDGFTVGKCSEAVNNLIAEDLRRIQGLEREKQAELAPPTPPRHTMFFTGRPSRPIQATQQPMYNTLNERDLALVELDKAIAEIDSTMPDLPLGNPARDRLMKTREHLLNARDEQRK